jgi:hypothetical protein
MNSDVEIIYIVDTSILIDIRRHYPIPDLWKEIENLFKSNRIISHNFVYEEIIPQKLVGVDGFTEMISRYKNNFLSTTQKQIDLVAEIINIFPGLIDHNSSKNQADPYLVAIAVELSEEPDDLFKKKEYIVVTSESKNKPMKIPAVCDKYKIRSINLFEFFEENGWKLSIK